MIHVLDNGQIAKGWIDVLVQTDTEWIIIDHKVSQVDHGVIVRRYAGQIFAYKEAVEAATGKAAKCWIHSPLAGDMVQIGYT